jgi:hypothetical protein
VISRPPPGPIEEQPPDQQPEGYAVEWISGYWSWDDERGDFIWISGIWREIPPGRQWVPGYWSQVEEGYQWTSGFWSPDDQEEVEYLPPPPQSQEIGPNVPAPSPDHTWTPGCWYWREERYVWTPGYWVAYQPDWVWVPPTYVYTPGGCIFVPGYWDYTLANRGLMFAPVYFNPVVIARPQYVYTPTVIIDSTVLTDHFFCRPTYRHYYFGDYYAAGGGGGGAVAAAGIVPWFAYQQSRTWYDPIYVHQRVVNIRSDPTWETRVRETYQYRTVHVDARPARTFVSQQTFVTRHQDAGAQRLVLARTLSQVGREDNARIRLQRIDRAQHGVLVQRQQQLQVIRERRVQLEAVTPARRQEARERFVVRKQELPRSPVADRGRQDRPRGARPFGDSRPGPGPGLNARNDPPGRPPGVPGASPGPFARPSRPRRPAPAGPKRPDGPSRPRARRHGCAARPVRSPPRPQRPARSRLHSPP